MLTDNQIALTRKQFDLLPWAVVIVDKNARIVFKNQFAYKTKFSRIGSDITNIFSKTNSVSFSACLLSGKPGVFKCTGEYGFSHALTIKLDDAETAVLFISNAILFKRLYKSSEIDSEMAVFNNTKKLVETYKQICQELGNTCPEETIELLKYNALRFSRAAERFSQYANALLHTEPEEPYEMCDIYSLCKEVISHFQALLSSRGYRLFIKSNTTFSTTLIEKRSFVSIFLEIISLCLLISDNSDVQIEIDEFDNSYSVIYHTKCKDIKTAISIYENRIDYLKTVSKNYKWSVLFPTEQADEDIYISLTVPAKRDRTTVSAPPCPFPIGSYSAKEMAEREFSVFYFE